MAEFKSFGSDNHSGVHPDVLKAIALANAGHQWAYGADSVTHSAIELFRSTFKAPVEVFFVFTGTASNTLAIRSTCRSFEAVVATTIAHINEDECGAPEYNTGCKILGFPAVNGKLLPSVIEGLRISPTDNHRVIPKLVSITQATELGTVYSPDEIRALTKAARARGLLVHMDGARLANAAAHLGCSLSELTTDVGLDVLSFGGTKNGLLCAEAVVFFRKDLAESFAYIRKQSMQLASKMRYLSSQYIPYLADELWLKNATAANAMAQYLRQKLLMIPGTSVPWETDANEVFAILPKEWSERLQKAGPAYPWDVQTGLIRFVCSFDTTREDVDRLFI
ncbi:MAG: threonine aldolase [Chitinophagaceae bacterium]|nr:threonine aldolase [Oligoflexus sp.]